MNNKESQEKLNLLQSLTRKFSSYMRTIWNIHELKKQYSDNPKIVNFCDNLVRINDEYLTMINEYMDNIFQSNKILLKFIKENNA